MCTRPRVFADHYNNNNNNNNNIALFREGLKYLQINTPV